MPRKSRPLDIELFGKALLEDDSYLDILNIVRDSEEGICAARDIVKRFSDHSCKSAVYKRLSNLERAKLVKVRCDGILNYLELTDRAIEMLESLGRGLKKYRKNVQTS